MSKKKINNAEKVIVVDGEVWTEQDVLDNWNETMPEWMRKITTFADYLNYMYENYGVKKEK